MIYLLALSTAIGVTCCAYGAQFAWLRIIGIILITASVIAGPFFEIKLSSSIMTGVVIALFFLLRVLLKGMNFVVDIALSCNEQLDVLVIAKAFAIGGMLYFARLISEMAEESEVVRIILGIFAILVFITVITIIIFIKSHGF